MSLQTKFSSYNILGSEVDAITINEAVDYVAERAGDRTTPPMYLVKQYVELLEQARTDRAIHALLNRSELAVPEGVSAQWAAAYLHGGRHSWWRALALAASIVLRPSAIQHPISEKFSGTIFTWKLLERCAQDGISIYLVGSPKHGAIADTIAFIEQKLPRLKIAGSWPGNLGGVSGSELRRRLPNEPLEKNMVNDLLATKPDIIFVAMGFPLQEELCAKLLIKLDHGFLIGEGGTFDYDSFGGKLPKAPSWVRRISLEWLWRLGLEPSRWRRQLAIPRFMWAVWQSGKTSRRFPKSTK